MPQFSESALYSVIVTSQRMGRKNMYSELVAANIWPTGEPTMLDRRLFSCLTPRAVKGLMDVKTLKTAYTRTRKRADVAKLPPAGGRQQERHS